MKWNVWTVLLVIAAAIIGLRIIGRVFSLLWLVGSFVLNIAVWVAAIFVVVYLVRFVVNKLRGR